MRCCLIRVLSCSRYLCCLIIYFFFFFKQKTAYEMRISDWSSDVCSSDLQRRGRRQAATERMTGDHDVAFAEHLLGALRQGDGVAVLTGLEAHALQGVVVGVARVGHAPVVGAAIGDHVLALVVLVDRRDRKSVV